MVPRKPSPTDKMGGCWPTMSADLEAKIGSHVDPTNPAHKEAVFGYLHRKITDLTRDCGLALPLGNATYAADVNADTERIDHRAARAVPVLPGQV